MSSHPLINHLNQFRDRITGMLMPGSTNAPGGQIHSSLLRDFGGLKYKVAARKMRSLDPAKLGRLQPSRVLQRLIPPFADAGNLLHLKLSDKNIPSSWSEVETVFPSSFGEAESSPLGGEFRQGSIIPRLATFPEPGQSVESFKKQVEQYPKAPAPPIEPPPQQLSPKSRLFSHVQEIETNKTDKSKDVVSSETEKKPPEPDREQGKSLELPQKQTEEKPPLEEEETLVQPPSEESPPITQPVVAKKTGSVKTKTPVTSTPSPEEKKQTTLPRNEIELPLAPPPRSPEKSTLKEKKPDGSEPRSSSQSPKAVKSSQKPPSTQPKPEIPASEPPAAESLASDVSLPGPVSEPEPMRAEETPLLKQIDYRKQSPVKARSLIPENIKPPASSPAQPGLDKPLISPQKYRPSTSAKVQRQVDDNLPKLATPAPPEQVSENLQPVTAPEEIVENRQPVRQTQTRNIQPEIRTLRPSSTSMSQPISMALAYPPRRTDHKNMFEKAKSPVPAAVRPAEKMPPKTQMQTLVTRSASTQNVIQRKWPENEGGAGPTTASAGTEAPEQSRSAGSAPTMDLTQLAEKVFPYLKRLIEIESDRLSSRFG